MASIPELKRLREEAFLSAPDVYKSAGIHRATYAKAEKGESVRRDIALKILKALNELFYAAKGMALGLDLIKE